METTRKCPAGSDHDGPGCPWCLEAYEVCVGCGGALIATGGFLVCPNDDGGDGHGATEVDDSGAGLL